MYRPVDHAQAEAISRLAILITICIVFGGMVGLALAIEPDTFNKIILILSQP